MKVLFVSPEVDPLVKVGGLADMVGALAKQLSRSGHDVRVVCPFYGSIRRQEGWEPEPELLTVRLGQGPEQARVWRASLPGADVVVLLLEHDGLYGRPEVYDGPWGPHGDNDKRYAFLSRAALDWCLSRGWIPDVVHGHDWTTGLVPVYLNTTDRGGPLGPVASVFTVHNLEHQGYCDRRVLPYAGIPWSEYRPDSLEAVGAVNLMKGGLYHSTKLTTVSPTYAIETQTGAFGCGLDPVLRFRSADLVGILNGIDEQVWNPATDALLPARYTVDDLSGKAVCKATLQAEMGLEVDPGRPVFGVVSRLYHQKGLDVVAEALPGILQNMHVQFVLLGSGDEALQRQFAYLQFRHPGRVAVRLGYNNRLAHLIEAGSDFFVMPSRFEPCGLNQMYSMRYGTPPIVRATGGLLDTVDQYHEGRGEGTGFIFEILSPEAFYFTAGWACSTWYDRPDDYRTLQRNGMRKDFSWDRSARRYEQVYRWAIEARAAGFRLERGRAVAERVEPAPRGEEGDGPGAGI